MEDIAMYRSFNSEMVKIGAIVILIEIIILAGVSFYDNNLFFWIGVIANIIIISLVILLLSYRMQQRMNSLRESEEAGNPLYYEGTVEDSTQRKQAEEALHQSKNLFQSLIEALPQNIFSKDLEGRFTFANQRYCMTEGKPLTDIIGKTDFDLHPTELAKKYRADDRRVFETRQTLEIVEEHQPLGGEKFYVQVIKTPMYDSDGQIIGILGIFWDITERRQAEEALRESEKRYRNLVENAPLGIISVDSKGNIIDVNSMLVAMLGSPSVEAIRGINLLTFPSLIEAGISRDFRHCLDSGLPVIAEHLYNTKWGKQVYLRYHLTPIRDQGNKIIGVQAIVEDSTERMLVEKALRESEAEYRSLFKNMHSGFAYHKILVDEQQHPIDYVFLEVNEAFETLTGLEDVIGKRATEVFPDIHTIELDLIQVYGQVALTGEKVTFDVYFESFGMWFSISAYSPEPGYFVTIFEDITERKWAEESLRKLNEELEQRVEARTIELQRTNTFLQESLETLERTQRQLVESEKMAALGGLVAGVAHEINTPLGIGVTAASHLAERSQTIGQLYQQGEMNRSDLEKFLTTANESTAMILENLRRAAENIKSFKQVAVDQTHDTKRVFKLKQCIDNVLLSLHPKLKKTSHTVMVQCPEDLELDSYPGAFSQIVTNFVMNSLIHGFEQKDQGCIELQIWEENDTLRMRYQDNGRGMSEDERAHIFEPFYTTKRGQGGSGLGLHIVYNLVTQALDGRITCESTPGSGTIFTIEIPMM
jgi:PAS domain S-box-containing protein